MANIRKTFNFRNGVQVDEDNFIVDSLGKVGVGTTVPSQFIDCRGNAKVVGIITSQSLETRNVNIAGVTTFSGTTHVGSAITMYPAAGIISATQIHGDGRNLINIPTSQWTDINAGLGHTSIYNEGFVGVSTNDPRFTLQVGGNNDLTTFANGVGINSSGNIVATGVITATNFKGDLQGAVTGTVTGHLNGTTLNVSGISTFAGITTSTSILYGKQLELSGIGTFADIWVQNPVDTRRTAIAPGALILSRDTPLIYFKNNLTDNFDTSIEQHNNQLRIQSGGNGATAVRFETSGIGVSVYGVATSGQFTGAVNAGVATVSTKLDLGSVSTQGIGTASPQSNLHVFNVGVTSIQVESGSAESILSLGTNVNTRQTSAEIVYGKTGLTYSDDGSLDVINYNNSHVNSVLHLGSQAGINTGSWNWIHGKDATNPKMTLTYAGNLGIGKTNASVKLDVVGVATVSTDLFVGANSWVAGNEVIVGNLTVNGTNNISIAGKNLDVTSGHSRVKNVDVTNALTVTGFTTFSGNVSVGGTFAIGNFNYTNDDGQVAITTNTFSNPNSVGVDARHTQVIARGIGIGKTTIGAAVDFSNAGRNNHDVVVPAGEVNRMYMIPPKVTTAERGNLAGVVAGATIYNTSTNKLQCHNGTSWQDCF